MKIGSGRTETDLGKKKGRNDRIDGTITENWRGRQRRSGDIVFITLFQSKLSTSLARDVCLKTRHFTQFYSDAPFNRADRVASVSIDDK